MLVLATPCPLLIAAPVAYVAGTARLAKQKILIKSQDVLENLGRVTHVFFDKTGTLTVKQPQVVRVEKAKDMPANVSEDEILMLAGMVEGFSVRARQGNRRRRQGGDGTLAQTAEFERENGE